jgi:hypothetical protein
MHTLHSIISFQNHKDSEQDDKTGNLFYYTASDRSPHHTSEKIPTQAIYVTTNGIRSS